MRFYMISAFLFLALLCCDARRRRKGLKSSAGSQSTNSGEIQESSSQSNHSVRMLNKVSSVEKSTDIPSRSLVKSSERVMTKRQKRRRKSRRNRKSKKQRKAKKKSRKQTGRTSPKRTKVEFDIFDKIQKELLRSTMRRMFGFDHMTGPRVNQEAQIDESHFAKSPRSQDKDTNERRVIDPPDQMNNDDFRTLPNPPDFMLELYRTYSEDKSLMRINSQSQGNTIRSFFSVAGETMSRLEDKEKPLIIIPYHKIKTSTTQSVDTDEINEDQNRKKIKVFAFDVTSIPATESIVAAELRLDGLRNAALNAASTLRSPNVSRSGWSANVAVYKPTNSNELRNKTRKVKIYQRVGRMIIIRPSSSFAWVDRRIARLSTKARREKHVLIVKFNHDEEPTLTRRRRNTMSSTENSSFRSPVSPETLTSALPNYFVVVGSDRKKRNSGASHNRPRSGRASPASLTPILIVYCNDTKTVVSSPDDPASNGIWGTLGNFSSSSAHKRTRRSSNRRLPSHSLSSSNGENINEIPGEIQREDTSGRTASHFSIRTSNDQTELHDNSQVQRRVIQQLQDRKAMAESRKGQRRKRGKKCKKRGRKGRKSRKCRKEKVISAPEPDLNRAQQVCSRKSLHVDFNDIGWSDWIISPKNFDAYYCSGLCELKTMKRAKPSNHAIVQAFIKSFEINPEVPAPCCVPDKLMSLSVLYFDRNDNVVLKVYPDMSVESCSCR